MNWKLHDLKRHINCFPSSQFSEDHAFSPSLIAAHFSESRWSGSKKLSNKMYVYFFIKTLFKIYDYLPTYLLFSNFGNPNYFRQSSDSRFHLVFLIQSIRWYLLLCLWQMHYLSRHEYWLGWQILIQFYTSLVQLSMVLIHHPQQNTNSACHNSTKRKDKLLINKKSDQD